MCDLRRLVAAVLFMAESLARPSFSNEWAAQVLLTSHRFEPVRTLAIKGFGNGEMRHAGFRSRTMPVPLAACARNDITSANLRTRATFTLRPADTSQHNLRLPQWMCVPESAGRGFERDDDTGCPLPAGFYQLTSNNPWQLGYWRGFCLHGHGWLSLPAM